MSTLLFAILLCLSWVAAAESAEDSSRQSVDGFEAYQGRELQAQERAIDKAKDALACGGDVDCKNPDQHSRHTPSAFSSSTGTTPRAQAGCSHYLSTNRFDWWHAVVPARGPISVATPPPDPVSSGDDVFRSEFCSPLSTVVGTHLDSGYAPDAGRTVSWDHLADGDSPNDIADIEFIVHARPSDVLPTLRQERVIADMGQQPQPRMVILHDVSSSHSSLDQPPLIIDFARPQRAVGVEFGIRGPNGATVSPRYLQMVALDEAGNRIVNSDGGQVTTERLPANGIYGKVGVRDQGGAIRSVALRYAHPDTALPLMVSRIWHESLPPAAVLQRTAAMEFNPYAGGDGFGSTSGYEGRLGSVSHRLPFRCNRATVLMRGFKLRALSGGRDVNAIEVGISAPAKFSVDRGGTISFDPTGLLARTSQQRPGYLAVIYYTVLAWDTDQVELNTEGGRWSHHLDGDVLGGDIVHRDPCPSARGQVLGTDRERICGPLFGALRGFSYRLNLSQEVVRLGLSVGRQGWGGCAFAIEDEGLGPGSLPQGNLMIPHLEPRGPNISLGLCSVMEGEDSNNHWRGVSSTVLSGRSLRLEESHGPMVFAMRQVGRRPSTNPFLYDLYARASGDIAFVALGNFYMEPDGPIAEIDVEVRGEEYDGEHVRWQLGGGIYAEESVSGGANSDSAWPLMGLPNVGALVRKSTPPVVRMVTQEARFGDMAIGARAHAAEQRGFIKNQGTVPAWITRASTGARGADYRDFDLWYEYRGQAYQELDDLFAAAPIELRPGEAIMVDGIFAPVERGDSDWIEFPFIRRTSVDFRIDDRRNRHTWIPVTGTVVAPYPRMWVAPEARNFSSVEVGRSRSYNFSVGSLGGTPLLIGRGELMYPDPSFRVTGFTTGQLDPGSFMDYSVTFRPYRLGQVDNRLIIETNAGVHELPLTGFGVPRQIPWPPGWRRRQDRTGPR